MGEAQGNPRSQNKPTGHRRWAARNGRVPGEYRGDIMSPETRSRVMSRIKGKDTRPEQLVMAGLRARGIEFETHVRDLPGRPDIVFLTSRLAVFIDGDFWHGWRFPLWKHKLSEKWREKIAATRQRDQRNFRKLRRSGWTVIRIWEHQIEKDLEQCLDRVVYAIKRES